MYVKWRIKRYRQPFHAIECAMEWFCGAIGHPGACALLNRHGGWLSAPYQWVATRSIVWEEIPQMATGTYGP